ncbi:hypothetical protein OF83DRAFT_1179452 [Amylostereum chailletii]|nr:hypothetical protein OF83DRAFT_1179452 [Amylostereum chailletii]
MENTRSRPEVSTAATIWCDGNGYYFQWSGEGFDCSDVEFVDPPELGLVSTEYFPLEDATKRIKSLKNLRRVYVRCPIVDDHHLLWNVPTGLLVKLHFENQWTLPKSCCPKLCDLLNFMAPRLKDLCLPDFEADVSDELEQLISCPFELSYLRIPTSASAVTVPFIFPLLKSSITALCWSGYLKSSPGIREINLIDLPSLVNLQVLMTVGREDVSEKLLSLFPLAENEDAVNLEELIGYRLSQDSYQYLMRLNPSSLVAVAFISTPESDLTAPDAT